MEVKVIGAGCPECDELCENTKRALQQLGIEAEVEHVGDLIEIVKLGVMSAPSLLVDGKLLVAGKVAKTDEIVKKLQGSL